MGCTRLPWCSGFVLFLASVYGMGCGTGATTTGGGSGGGSSGSEATADADADATSPGTAQSATSMMTSDSAEGSDDAPGCPAFDDEASPGPITIEVTNMRAEGVWLPMSADCIEPVPYVLAGPDGLDVPWRAPACGTCEGAVQGQCPCPPPFCDEVTALFVEPGATVQYTWSGLVHVDEAVPDACPGIDMCGASCQRAAVAPDGPYTFTIEAGGATGCAVPPCACMPMDGSCTLLDPGMMFTGLTSIEGVLALPGESVVQIPIE